MRATLSLKAKGESLKNIELASSIEAEDGSQGLDFGNEGDH